MPDEHPQAFYLVVPSPPGSSPISYFADLEVKLTNKGISSTFFVDYSIDLSAEIYRAAYSAACNANADFRVRGSRKYDVYVDRLPTQQAVVHLVRTCSSQMPNIFS